MKKIFLFFILLVTALSSSCIKVYTTEIEPVKEVSMPAEGGDHYAFWFLVLAVVAFGLKKSLD